MKEPQPTTAIKSEKTHLISARRTEQLPRDNNQDRGDRTRQVVENKQAAMLKGNLFARAETYADKVDNDLTQLSAFLSQGMRNPVWTRAVCIRINDIIPNYTVGHSIQQL